MIRRCYKIEECIFCKIVKGDIPASKCYEDEDILAFEDINPVAPVHIIIIPKKHITDVLDIENNNDIMNKIIIAIKQIANEKGIVDSGFRIVTNYGSDGGQEVPHLHFHLLGGRKLKSMG